MAGTLVVAALGTVALPLAAHPAVTGTAAWPSFQHDPLHGGVSPDTTPGATSASKLTLKWKTVVEGAGSTPPPVQASPAVLPVAKLHATVAFIASADSTSSQLDAINTASGAVLWHFSVPAKVFTSPAVSGNTVYVAGQDTLYAINTATGKLQCRFDAGGRIFSSPVVAKVGAGPVVYFGDTGQSEADNAGHEWAVNGVGGPAGACTLKWSFDDFINKGAGGSNTGSWSPPSLATDSTGRQVVVFGSSQPDDAVYDLDAATGSTVWSFQTTPVGTDDDVGAGPTIAAPGVNGVADGVVYIDGKDNNEYAIDLLTGHQLWSFAMAAGAGASAICQSTAALAGRSVVVPDGATLYAFDAVTGAELWRSAAAGANFLASPAVSGAAGNQVAFVGDLAGVEHGYRLSDGAQVFSYTTGAGSISSSAAVTGGQVYFGASDGDLYALG